MMNARVPACYRSKVLLKLISPCKLMKIQTLIFLRSKAPLLFLEENSDIELHENSSSSRSLVISGSSSSSSNQANENSIFDKRFCSDRLNAVSVVSPVNLTASLINLVSKHSDSDALLNDLLKRDQALFGERAITPWTVKTQFREFCDRYQSEKIVCSNGELILIKFRILL